MLPYHQTLLKCTSTSLHQIVCIWAGERKRKGKANRFPIKRFTKWLSLIWKRKKRWNFISYHLFWNISLKQSCKAETSVHNKSEKKVRDLKLILNLNITFSINLSIEFLSFFDWKFTETIWSVEILRFKKKSDWSLHFFLAKLTS